MGSGDVGQALAQGFKAEGHDVMMGTREPEGQKAKDIARKLGVATGTFETAAQHADVAVLCTLWAGTEHALELAGSENLSRKIVIDCTNPLKFEEGKGPQLALGHTDSGGEQVQRWLPESHVVKAFNSVGNAHMYKPKFSETPTMFICGNDQTVKQTVTDILTTFGWETVDTGDITGARELEPLCILWVKYGMQTNSWDHAFKLLRSHK